MLLESDLRPLITASLLCLTLSLSGGCDRESAPKEQPRTPEIAATPQAQPQKGGSMGLESANGLRATLTYAYRGRPAPAAAFTGADGRDVSLSDYAGRPLLVNLWATWCAPCKAEMPTLDALAQLEEGRVSVIAVSQDLQGRKPVNAFSPQRRLAIWNPLLTATMHCSARLAAIRRCR